MTAYASVPTAVQAMREGAYDYVTKPFDPDKLRALVERAIAQAAVLKGEQDAPDAQGFAGMTGRSPAMRALYQLIERVAPTDATVLLLGETGTGKELIARAIHEPSARRDQTFVRVSAARPTSPARFWRWCSTRAASSRSRQRRAAPW